MEDDVPEKVVVMDKFGLVSQSEKKLVKQERRTITIHINPIYCEQIFVEELCGLNSKVNEEIKAFMDLLVKVKKKKNCKKRKKENVRLCMLGLGINDI